MCFRNIIFLSAIICTFFSCGTKKNTYYLQNLEDISDQYAFNNIIIQRGDILDIKISSLDPESVLIFQPQRGNNQTNNFRTENLQISGYFVGDNGVIELPILGNVEVLGETTQNLSKKINQLLLPYFKNISVKVTVVNFKFTLLGEVNRPGTYSFLEERISLPQALGYAGDLTINGDRKNVILLRDDGKKKISYSLDLTDTEFMKSEVYYLKQNDIIYVKQNLAKVKSSGLFTSISSFSAALSFISSLILLLSL